MLLWIYNRSEHRAKSALRHHGRLRLLRREVTPAASTNCAEFPKPAQIVLRSGSSTSSWLAGTYDVVRRLNRTISSMCSALARRRRASPLNEQSGEGGLYKNKLVNMAFPCGDR